MHIYEYIWWTTVCKLYTVHRTPTPPALFCILWSRYNRMFNQSSLFAITRLHSTNRLDYKLVRGVDLDNLTVNQISHRIHVWYIYLHLVYLHLTSKSTKCMGKKSTSSHGWVMGNPYADSLQKRLGVTFTACGSQSICAKRDWGMDGEIGKASTWYRIIPGIYRMLGWEFPPFINML